LPQILYLTGYQGRTLLTHVEEKNVLYYTTNYGRDLHRYILYVQYNMLYVYNSAGIYTLTHKMYIYRIEQARVHGQKLFSALTWVIYVQADIYGTCTEGAVQYIQYFSWQTLLLMIALASSP